MTACQGDAAMHAYRIARPHRDAMPKLLEEYVHAGVWVVCSLVLQVLLDSAMLAAKLTWLGQISAPEATVAISGRFFGLVFVQAFRGYCISEPQASSWLWSKLASG
jgi:hypothetical protein